MEGRIRHIQALLERAEIVEDDAGGRRRGRRVGREIRYEGDDDAERTYLIGSIEERHDELDVISPGSPLGQALDRRQARRHRVVRGAQRRDPAGRGRRRRVAARIAVAREPAPRARSGATSGARRARWPRRRRTTASP